MATANPPGGRPPHDDARGAPPAAAPYPPGSAGHGASEPGHDGPPGPGGGYGPPPPRPPGAGGAGWTGGRVFAVVVGVVLVLLGLGGLGVGATLGFAHLVLRDDGYVTAPSQHVSSSAYAVVLGDVDLHADGMPLDWPGRLLGDVRVRAAADDGGEVFVGVGTASDVSSYLDGVRRDVMTEARRRVELDGGAPAVPPAEAGVWLAQAAGPGVQSVETELRGGRWVTVVMAPDASPGIDARVDVGATLPWLPWAALIPAVVGLVLVASGAVLINAGSRRAALG